MKGDRLRTIELVLKNIYSQHKSKGILSIYLWGSVLTDDYDPESSDIDSMAIVDERADEKDREEINGLLKTKLPQYKNFKLNYLYLSDLSGGEIKGRPAKKIDPRLLLLDFDSWKHVAGKRFKQDDFELKEIDFDEAVRLNLQAIKERYIPRFKKNDYGPGQYFAKYVAKICHHLNQKEQGKHPFKYSELAERSPEKRKEIANIIVELRRNSWNESLLKKNLPFLIDFIDQQEQAIEFKEKHNRISGEEKTEKMLR